MSAIHVRLCSNLRFQTFPGLTFSPILSSTAMVKRRLNYTSGKPSKTMNSRRAPLRPKRYLLSTVNLLSCVWSVSLLLFASVSVQTQASSPAAVSSRWRLPFRSLSLWGKHSRTNASKDSLFENLNTTDSRQIATNESSSAGSPFRNQNTTSALPLWKQTLPERLRRRSTLQRICIPTSTSTNVEVYLLGTSHVSNDSSADVTLLLQSIRPDLLFVELCEQRIHLLTPLPDNDDSLNNDEYHNISLWKRVKQIQQHSNMSRLSALSTVLLTRVQHQYADSLGVQLGSEFRAAYDYCQQQYKHASSPDQQHSRPLLILGDRPLQITLLRAWEGLSWWEKIKIVGALLWSSMQKPNPDELREWMRGILEHSNDDENPTDLLTESIHELRRHMPSLETTIIQERDCYMACKLYQMAGMLSPPNLPYRNMTCVAIVGAGHCAGMIAYLTNRTKSEGKNPQELLWNVVRTNKFGDEDVESLTTHVTELPMVL